MQEIRCQGCNKLLFKSDGSGSYEIKCPRCGLINRVYSIAPPKITKYTGRVLYEDYAAALVEFPTRKVEPISE